MRQLDVVDVAERDLHWPQALWQINLGMAFDGGPDLVDIEDRDTGFNFDPVGPRRTAALAEVRTELARYPRLRSMWRMTPVSSELSFEAVR